MWKKKKYWNLGGKKKGKAVPTRGCGVSNNTEEEKIV